MGDRDCFIKKRKIKHDYTEKQLHDCTDVCKLCFYGGIMIVTTQAIILKSRKFKESSKLIVAYTQEYGKLSFVANGARRITKKGASKYGAALDVLSISTLTFQKKEGRDLHTLMSGETVQSSLGLQDSYSALTTGFALVESILSTQLEEQAHPDIFALALSAIQALHHVVRVYDASTTDAQVEAVLVSFYIRLAERMGFALHPFRCPVTQEDIHPRQAEYFTLSFSDGAPFQPRVAGLHQGLRVDTYTLEALQMLFVTDIEKVESLSVERFALAKAHEFLARYFLYHCERALTPRTDAFMREW
jgi:DNA repair protein RecO